MAVTLRLTRRGQKKRPFYRIVAADTAARRDGRFLEIIGTYNPLTQPATISIKEDRVRYWVGVGAKQSRLVGDIIKKQIPGLLEERNEAKKAKCQERRKKRKASLKAKSA